jgi:hypothetical protein
MGYGDNLETVGRIEVIRHLPHFPASGVPTLKVEGYDRSWRMMRQELKIKGGQGSTPTKGGRESGQVHWGELGFIVEVVLAKYGVAADVDPEVATKRVDFTQRKGTSDLKMLRALANVNDCEFWIEYDTSTRVVTTGSDGTIHLTAPGRWVGRMRKATSKAGAGQTTKYTFVYGQGDKSTLIECDLEYAISSSVSEVQAWVWDRGKNDWGLISTEKTKAGRSPRFSAGTFLNDPKGPPGGEADPIESMSKIKIAASGHSIEVLTQRFRSAAEATEFVEAWFKKYRDAFVIAKGRIVGCEKVRAGQVHTLDGIGSKHSGDFYFSIVRHTQTGGNYVTEFTARKVIDD